MINLYKKIFGSLVFAFSLFFAKTTFAVCQVCTFAVIGGTFLAREYGIDDSITGLWIGALTLLAYQWTVEWIEKLVHKKGKRIKVKAKQYLHLITFAFYYAIVIWPMTSMGMIGIVGNKFMFLDIDKILFGIIIGTIVFFGMQKWYEKIKKDNNGKALFPFQKVVMPVVSLIILSIIFYFYN